MPIKAIGFLFKRRRIEEKNLQFIANNKANEHVQAKNSTNFQKNV